MRATALMTDRGRGALALAGAAYLAAWSLGAELLYPVSIGLVVSFLVAFVWVRLLRRPMRIVRRLSRSEVSAGEDIPIDVSVEVGTRRLPPSAVTLVDRIAGLGEVQTQLRRQEGRFVGHYTLRSVPRGRYPIESSCLLAEDPFALERLEVQLEGHDALLVYPRVVEIDRLFSETGRSRYDGRQQLLHRSTGFAIHSVREYQEGESLRRVHWPTTARVGQLMVKELEDSPREEVSVVLDAYAFGDVGRAPESSFELAVSAAGSLIRSYAKRGRPSALVLNGRERPRLALHSEEDWRATMTLLAAAEADGTAPLERLLDDETGPVARSLELVVVTSMLTPQLVERLLRRRRATSLVYVEPTSFTGAEKLPLETAGMLARLEREGLPVALLRHGDDLARMLGGSYD